MSIVELWHIIPKNVCNQAVILDLHFGENRFAPEIASRLGLDVHAVHRLLRRGKRDFRAALMEVMAAYSPEATEAELTRKCIDLMTTC